LAASRVLDRWAARCSAFVKQVGSGAWADMPGFGRGAFVTVLVLLGTAKVQDGIVALEELETHFPKAESPDQWNQGLVQMERMACFEANGRLRAREIHAIANDRNGSLCEGSHFAPPLGRRLPSMSFSFERGETRSVTFDLRDRDGQNLTYARWSKASSASARLRGGPAPIDEKSMSRDQ
jgi:hypothetical protein